MALDIRPVDFKTAQDFVKVNHRHNKPPVGHKFSIGCYDGDKLVGVAMVGRPVGRYLDDGLTLEVNRCCTDGTKNACSMLYGASWRAAKALGYKRIFTYTRQSEGGLPYAPPAGSATAKLAVLIGLGQDMSRPNWYWTR